MKIILKLILVGLLLCSAVSLHVHHKGRQGINHLYNWGHYNSDSEPPKNQLRERWLAQVPNDRLISMLSIPGTHDTGTYNCRWYQACDISQCQTWNVYWQLKAGIRFLDFRVNTDGSTLMMGHGGYTYDSLETALYDVKKFLSENPTEFVITSFQKNSGDLQKNEQIIDLIKRLGLPYFLTWGVIPTVGQIRGQILITRSYGNSILGSYPLYGKQGVTNDGYAYMQNMYNVYTTNKNQKVRLVIQTAKLRCWPYKFKANFLSGSAGVFPYWLARIDGGTNQVMDSWLKQSNYKGCLGLTIMDYPGSGLINRIIDSNF